MNLTSIVHFINGAILLVTGFSLRNNKASRAAPVFFGLLAGVFYLWGTASLLTQFTFWWEGKISISLAGFLYFVGFVLLLFALVLLNRKLWSQINPEIGNLLTKIFLLWTFFFLFLLVTHLPDPSWGLSNLVEWNLPPRLEIVLGTYLALLGLVNTILFLYLAAGAASDRIKLRGYLLGVGLAILTLSVTLPYFDLSWESRIFASMVSLLGPLMTLAGSTLRLEKLEESE